MLPPVFFSTVSRTEKQSGKEKRTLSISQILTVDKKDNHEFPDKIVFFGGGGGGGKEGVIEQKRQNKKKKKKRGIKYHKND